MFLALSNTKAAESIFIFQDNAEETKDFSIFQDKSLCQNSLQQNNEKANRIKKYNEDGSLFVYDANQTEITYKREPLKLISKPASETTPLFEMTIEQSAMTTTRNDYSTGGVTDLEETNNRIEFDPDSASTRFIPKKADYNNVDSNNTSKIDFEPPAASTCFIKPILKSSKISQDVFNNENKNLADKEIEKEKLLELHLANNKLENDNNETNMTKFISEDCMTQMTNFTKSNKVRFNENSEKKAKSDETPSQTNKSEFEKTRVIGPNLSWESESQFMNNDCVSNNNTEVEIDFSLIKSSVKIVENNESKIINNYEMMSSDENEPLTSEKLDQTFQNDYHRLYFDNGIENTPALNQTSVTTLIKNINKEVDDQINKFNLNESVYQQMVERSIANLTQPPKNETILEETTINDNKEDDVSLSNNTLCEIAAVTTTTTTTSTNDNNKVDVSLVNNILCEMVAKTDNKVDVTLSSNNLCESVTTITTTTTTTSHKGDITFSNNTLSETIYEENSTNQNETILQAVKDPFNFEIKKRLLERGPISVLKMNKNYKSLCTCAPMIREKTACSLNDNETYDVLKEIGKGAYAKIYLIQNKNAKDKKYALKVDRQATAWEFYITEIIHERLATLSNENKMLINVKNSFVKIQQFMKYSDGCFSAMNYYKNGSLLVSFLLS